MTFIPEMLRIAEEIEPIITGLLVLMIVLFFPSGILGSLAGMSDLGKFSLSRRLREIKAWFNPKGSIR